jgi:hypothetical protein
MCNNPARSSALAFPKFGGGSEGFGAERGFVVGEIVVLGDTVDEVGVLVDTGELHAVIIPSRQREISILGRATLNIICLAILYRSPKLLNK